MINLYMARHGECPEDGNVYYGWTDIQLSAVGEKQCQELKNKLSRVKFDAVLSSPLERALHSAEIICSSRDKIIKCNELKEMNFGKWEKMTYLDVKNKFGEEWKSWTDDWQDFCIPGGESFTMLFKRVKKCLEDILKKNKNKNLLIVGHESTLRIIAVILLNMRVEDYWRFNFEPGCFSLIEIQEDITIIKKINV